ncbi:hypothetical protein BT96DRAFT_1083498, partial [Gymnopus androsaceus JB14]
SSTPFNALYLLVSAIVFLFIRLPYWTLALPSCCPRPQWSLIRCLCVSVFRKFLDIIYSSSAVSPSTPRSKDLTRKGTPGEKVLYLFHGGGFIYLSQRNLGCRKSLKSQIFTLYFGILKHTSITRLFALEYRLSFAPPSVADNLFPTAMIDAIAGYRYLVEERRRGWP